MVYERTDIGRGANDTVIAMDVRRIGETITRMINVYDQRDTQSGERPALILNW